MSKNHLFLSLILFFPIAFVYGQEMSFEDVKKLYPDENAVYTKYYLDLDISVENNKLIVKGQRLEEKLLLSEQASLYAKDKIYTSSFEELSDIEAYTLTPYKNRFKKEKVESFKETYDKNSSVFYDDTKVLNLIYPAVSQGAKTFITYNEQHNEPRFVPSYYFQTYIPVLDGRYSVTADKEVSLKFISRNIDGFEIDSSFTDEKDRVKYSFEIKNSDKLKFEPSSPNFKYFSPHINLLIESYKTSTGVVPLLKDEESLYSWYKTFIKDLKEHESENLKSIVADITEGLTTEIDKVKAIYYWVQDNIKYIAFEDGMRGLIPHNGEYVCEKRFGDCKDMASILINMMNIADIESYFTWVGTRDIPYNYSKTPSPIVDNHMIATYINDGKHYFLDATSQNSPFGLPSSMIQGKEVLIGMGEHAKIETVPVIDKEENVMADTITLELKNGVIKGKGRVTLTGYAKVFNTYRLSKKNEASVKNYLLTLLAKGSNKFLLDEYNVSNLEDMDMDLTVDYSFTVNDYYNHIGSEIYINPNLDKSYVNDMIDEDRENPKENEYKYTNRIVSKLLLPEGYKPTFLPENSSYKNEIFGFDINYTVEKDHIIIVKEFYLDYLLLEKKNFDQWNKAIKLMSESLRESIILTETES